MPGNPLMAMLTKITATGPISANQPLSSASHTYKMGGGMKRRITRSKKSCFLISCMLTPTRSKWEQQREVRQPNRA
eukprot:g4509.t1